MGLLNIFRREKEEVKAVENKIKINTVTIHDIPWQRELSEMINGFS